MLTRGFFRGKYENHSKKDEEFPFQSFVGSDILQANAKPTPLSEPEEPLRSYVGTRRSNLYQVISFSEFSSVVSCRDEKNMEFVRCAPLGSILHEDVPPGITSPAQLHI